MTELEGVKIELSADDVLVEPIQREGYISMSDRGLTVVLDTNLTAALIDEGFVREIVSKVQTMRKEAGFEVTDHIVLSHAGSARIEEILARFGADVASDTLAESIVAGSVDGAYVKEWDVNGETVTLGVKKAAC